MYPSSLSTPPKYDCQTPINYKNIILNDIIYDIREIIMCMRLQ